MKTRISVSTFAPVVLLGVLIAAITTHGRVKVPATGSGSTSKSPAVLIRSRFVPGRVMRYNLKLSGTAAWAPHEKGPGWGKMNTDFTFDLATKVIRDSGACTFFLAGQKIKSSVTGPKGRLGIIADRKKSKIRINDQWQSPSNKTPLTKEMTLTQGPLGGVRFTTGVAPIALYLLPHVDLRFWTLLTVAPLAKVAPGDEWSETFNLRVPGSRGRRPLKLTGRWKVVGYQQHRGRKVIVLALAVKMDLKNSNVMLKNGDLVYVHSGSYAATGKAMWDVSRGVLCYATADQKILIRADKPKVRALRSEHKCTLELKSFKEGTK
ncbi:MAG: hypothetical protein QGH60_24105 [Phycisphaerae bacterium]|nr:hypothetical protein [Phycisphaerae bacterium]